MEKPAVSRGETIGEAGEVLYWGYTTGDFPPTSTVGAARAAGNRTTEQFLTPPWVGVLAFDDEVLYLQNGIEGQVEDLRANQQESARIIPGVASNGLLGFSQ